MENYQVAGLETQVGGLREMKRPLPLKSCSLTSISEGSLDPALCRTMLGTKR